MIDNPSSESRARPADIIFEVTETVEGGYDAKALGYSIYTQGENWDDLKEMARDAVCCHFDGKLPTLYPACHLLGSSPNIFGGYGGMAYAPRCQPGCPDSKRSLPAPIKGSFGHCGFESHHPVISSHTRETNAATIILRDLHGESSARLHLEAFSSK